MSRWSILFNKEWLESRRNFKLLWLPIVFILLGITQPLITFYMPQILQAAGGLPEGVSFTFPELSGAQVMASTLSEQFDQLGLFIIIISMMGVVSGDKNSGMLSFMLTRSTSLTEYVSSKWLAQAIIVIISILAGCFASYYYVDYLYSSISFTYLLLGVGIYLIWCLFIFTLTMALSAILGKNAAVAFLSIVVLIVLKVATVLREEIQMFNPAYLTNHAVNMLTNGETLSSFAPTVIVTVLLMLVLMLITKTYLAKKELVSM